MSDIEVMVVALLLGGVLLPILVGWWRDGDSARRRAESEENAFDYYAGLIEDEWGRQ